jgi:hypothetical protein
MCKRFLKVFSKMNEIILQSAEYQSYKIISTYPNHKPKSIL